ncbi:MAG: VanW family protein [Clostridia bacterium]|nr:VanW family protein [Clostridia bacterium]
MKNSEIQMKEEKEEQEKEEVIANKKVETKEECEKEDEISEEGKHKNKEESKNKKSKKIMIIICFSIFIILIFSFIFALININNSNIISGVLIEGIDVSGIGKQQAKEKLEEIYNEKLQKQILTKYEDYESEINPISIETKYNIEKAVEEAYQIGRNSNILSNNYTILFTLIGKKDIKVGSQINEEITKNTIKDIESKLPGAIVESSYYQEEDDNTLVITKGTPGIKINDEKMIEEIRNILNNISETKNYIEIPVENKEPDPINIDKIHEEVYKEAKDAYYTKDPFTIYPEVYGVDFDVDEAKELIKEDKEEYVIKLKITKPKITVEEFGEEAFPDRLAIFTTKYNAGEVDRTTNLRIACQKINGKVILPGDIFSYNATLGERTVAAGYKEAKIFSAGQVVDGLGGGICQISSTLYNAVVMANLEIVERRNHQFVTSYLPAGRDATVVYGLTDFKFKNTRKYPIKIKAGVQGGIATISVYGMKEDEEYDITLETRTIGTIPFSTQYEEDDSIEEGKETVKQNGANGIQTETYKIMSQNGNVVSRSLLSKDTYTPKQKIIIKGTKSEQIETPVEENNTESVVVENSTEQEPKTEITEAPQEPQEVQE